MAIPDPASVPMIDQTAVFEHFEDDIDLIRDIVQLFLDACPRRLSTIHEAITLGDGHALQAAAHSLRGSASNFGAAAVVAAALQLEGMGHANDLSNAAAAYRVLEREVACLRTELVALRSAVSKEVH